MRRKTIRKGSAVPVVYILRGPFKPTLDKRDAWLRTCIAGLPPLRGGRWKHESVRAATHLPRRAGSNWAPHDIADRGASSGASLFFVVASFVSFALTASGRAHSLRCSSSPRRTAPPGSPRLFYSSKLRIVRPDRKADGPGGIRKPPIPDGIGGLSRFFVYQKIRRAATSRIP